MAKRKEKLICPGCNKTIKEDDLSFETRAVTRDHKVWHRACHLQTTKEYSLMVQLMEQQDDPDIDPQTALSDLIGDLGHFADINGIDFEEAVRRGLNYYQEERAGVPA